MKRIILILIIGLVALSGMAQQKITTKILSAKLVTQDTTVIIRVSDDYTWNITASWTGNTGTTTTAGIYESGDNGATYSAYANMSTATLATSTGSVSFEDYMTAGTHLAVKILVQSGTQARVTLYSTLTKKQ